MPPAEASLEVAREDTPEGGRGGIRQLTVSHMMCDVKVASHLKKHCPKNSNMKGFHEYTTVS